MSIRISRGPVQTAALGALLLAAAGVSSAGAQDTLGTQFRAHLEAGEFGPAERIAAGADPAMRDRMLGEIARTQHRTGLHQASLSTASGIAGDDTRQGLMDFLGGQPVGGGRGGAAMADFDTLIELITTTIAPDSWEELGGPGAIESFPTGVYVDADGLLKKMDLSDGGRTLAATRRRAALAGGNRDVRETSVLRKVSLTRLERRLQRRAAQRQSPDSAMTTLAGLYKVQYVFVYPESGDIVIAGPAGDWRRDEEGRSVNVATGAPTLQLDDLVVMLRNAQRDDPTFGCNITPVKERLAATKAYLEESSKKPLKQHQRRQWLEDLRSTLGKQDIEVFGIDPRTRAARVIVEADYRMKLVGMGIEDPVAGVESYLQNIKLDRNGNPPAMSVLRWWFTLNYDALRATPSHDGYQLRGPGAKVLSENEFLTALGERIHTGKSDEPTWQFAHSFTQHFEAMAQKYPIYAELRNVFDLALVASLIKSEDLSGQVDWQMLHFLDPERCPVELAAAPKQVETVINHRVINGRHIVAGISGGVRADLRQVVHTDSFETADYGLLQAEREQGAKPTQLPDGAWWWD